MKPAFHLKVLNGPYEDPTLYVRLACERRALLFDAGDLRTLSLGDVQRVSDVFVTHLHVDHFFGFDVLLRTLLKREHPLNVYGPEGLTGCVEGKLHGYAWNLVAEYPLRIRVHEVGALGDTVRTTDFAASHAWHPEFVEQRPLADGLLLEEDTLCVRTAVVDHGLPCLAFALEEQQHININKAALEEMGIPTGPWLTEFKRLIRAEEPDSLMVETPEGPRLLGELRHAAIIAEGQKVSYVMDCAPTQENLDRIGDLIRDSGILYCEAFFTDEDRERAIHRRHLTGVLAGELALRSGVRTLVPMHMSSRYKGRQDMIGRTPDIEAMRVFSSASAPRSEGLR